MDNTKLRSISISLNSPLVSSSLSWILSMIFTARLMPDFLCVASITSPKAPLSWIFYADVRVFKKETYRFQ